MVQFVAPSFTICEIKSARQHVCAKRASKIGLTKKEREELRRIHTAELYSYMRKIAPQGIVAGIDEVGRGALAGPLTVACVVLPDDPQIIGIDDSKKLSPKRRSELASQIKEHALGIGISYIEPDEIDACGMAMSIRVAMKRALEACLQDLSSHGNGGGIDAVLVDGNPVHIHENEVCVVKGDGKLACIAAASIVAKVTRDDLMCEYALEFPEYGFDSNKGYGSAAHMDAIRKYGPCSIHRRSFLGNVLSEQQTLL